MTATVTRGSPTSGNTGAGSSAPGAGVPARRTARRRGLGFPRASTTPGKVRLTRAGLVAACRAWGALAGAFTGLVAGVAVLTLAMAAGCTWGLSRRLAEYR